MKSPIIFLSILSTLAAADAAMTWQWNAEPGDPGIRNQIADSMTRCVETWNAYSDYDYKIGAIYSAGTPTADAGHLGQIRFGGQRNFRTAFHESSHWMGSGSVWQWPQHMRFHTWTGTYAYNLRCAFDGPGERIGADGMHYWPYGANFDGEGVDPPKMIGIIGGFRRDMGLEGGDRTIGIAPGTYRLRNRQTIQMLDAMGGKDDTAHMTANGEVTGQRWQLSRVGQTKYFTLRSAECDKCLDAGKPATDKAPLRLLALAKNAEPADSQQWEIVPTDSFFFRIINKANGKVLDSLNQLKDGAKVAQAPAADLSKAIEAYGKSKAGDSSPPPERTQEWTFVHPLVQSSPPPGVISQGRPTKSSSTDEGHVDWMGNNGVAGDRWTAADGKYPQWWRVDLGSVQPITKVAIDWFSERSPKFQYTIDVSNDDKTYKTIVDQTHNTKSGTTSDTLAVKARYVRVSITGASAGWAAFMECRVYNETQPLQLLSQFRPATASSEQEGNLAVNATDVDPTFTRWSAGSAAFPAWWQVDLGSPQKVNKAVIQWFDDDARSYQYKIEGSLDGRNFTTLIDKSDNKTPVNTLDLFSGVARYVRITVTGGTAGWAGFYDAQIYGLSAPLRPAPPATASEPQPVAPQP